jgi:hypothetical protein
MSHAATNWAIQQRGLKPTTKILLWHLCDRFNPDYGCFPSQVRLAHDCEIGRATLNRHLDDLEARGLIRRIRNVDLRTGQHRPTRYLLSFEPCFKPPGPGGENPQETGDDAPFDPDIPCPNLGHGTNAEKMRSDNGLAQEISQTPCLDLEHGPVSHFDAIPCLKNSDSRVSNWDTNLVREPLSKPVKEEEDAQARDSDFDGFFEELVLALGLDPAALPGWWQGWPSRMHVQRWRTELELTEAEIVSAAKDTRKDHPEPPDGPKALDRAMQRAAQRKTDDAGRKRRKRKTDQTPAAKTIVDLPVFYAEIINSDRYLPVSAINNTMRDAMLGRGLVTPEQLRERGVR